MESFTDYSSSKAIIQENMGSDERNLTLSSLPYELRRHIFSNLSIEELNACSLVNKEWKQLSQDDCLWRQIGREKLRDFFSVKSSYSEKTNLMITYHAMLISFINSLITKEDSKFCEKLTEMEKKLTACMITRHFTSLNDFLDELMVIIKEHGINDVFHIIGEVVVVIPAPTRTVVDISVPLMSTIIPRMIYGLSDEELFKCETGLSFISGPLNIHRLMELLSRANQCFEVFNIAEKIQDAKLATQLLSGDVFKPSKEINSLSDFFDQLLKDVECLTDPRVKNKAKFCIAIQLLEVSEEKNKALILLDSIQTLEDEEYSCLDNRNFGTLLKYADGCVERSEFEIAWTLLKYIPLKHIPTETMNEDYMEKIIRILSIPEMRDLIRKNLIAQFMKSKNENTQRICYDKT